MKTVLLGLVLLIAMPPAFAGQPVTFSTSEGAIQGYDPVAYFTIGEPTEGLSKYSTRWQGAIYKFASNENLMLFKSDPQRYSPQYGGYCAYAVSRGATAMTDPEAWTIVNGKLYLNFSNSVRQRWSRDIPGNISAANRNWPDVLN